MNDLQEVKFSMFIAVRNFITGKPELEAIPIFTETSTRFNSIVGQIEQFRLEQGASREGFSRSKATIREELISLAFDMSRTIIVYAKGTNNDILRKEVDFSLSELRFATDAVLQNSCGIISLRASANLEDLADYDVTEELVEALSTKLAEFTAAMPTPKAARTNHKLITANLKALIVEADALLKDKMDLVFDMFRIKNPMIYNAYREARALNSDYGTRKLAVIVSVSDTAGTPISKVNASIEGITLTKKTTDKGKFRIEILPAGTYTFNFNRGGYKPAHATVVVIDGITTKVNVVMEQIAETVSMPG